MANKKFPPCGKGKRKGGKIVTIFYHFYSEKFCANEDHCSDSSVSRATKIITTLSDMYHILKNTQKIYWRHRVSYHLSFGLKSLDLPTALPRFWRNLPKKDRNLYLWQIIPDLSPFPLTLPAWRKIGNFLFAICTWPNSPVKTKFLSRFQFQGKSCVWISQVRRVKSLVQNSLHQTLFLLHCSTILGKETR